MKIYAIECWEDSWGGGNISITGYFRFKDQAEHVMEQKKTKKDPALHYKIKEIEVF